MTLEQTGKKMPFNEKDGYVEQLVNKVTEQAISKGTGYSRSASIPMRYVAGIAASVLLLIGSTFFWYQTKEEPQALAQTVQHDPLGTFLNNISDEEAKQIEFYEIEELYY